MIPKAAITKKITYSPCPNKNKVFLENTFIVIIATTAPKAPAVAMIVPAEVGLIEYGLLL